MFGGVWEASDPSSPGHTFEARVPAERGPWLEHGERAPFPLEFLCMTDVRLCVLVALFECTEAIN